MLTLETVAEFSDVIALLEDIGRLHRKPNRELLLERYGLVRKKMISIRSGRIQLDIEHDQILQKALTTIAQLQDLAERDEDHLPNLNASKSNRLISKDMDAILTALNGIKRDRSGI